MKHDETFYTSDRTEWRAWFSEHFETETEVWFVFPMKESGEASLSYNDAVEEALCFGWIDSTIKHIDPLHRAQRFTPRKDFSYYSRPNIERLIWLDKRGMIHPKVRPSVAEVIETEYVFPEDILDAIRADETAWENYQKFTDSYRRIRVAYIDAARKRPPEFQKRLSNFIAKTRANKLIAGFGGIDKYYLPEFTEPTMKTTVSEGVDMDSIEQIIKNTTEENQSKTDWTKAWSTKYPILKIYQNEVDIPLYAGQIREMFTDLQNRYGYSELDAMLVLKDILAHEYMDHLKK